MDLSSKTLMELYKLNYSIEWEILKRFSPVLIIIIFIIIVINILLTNKRGI